MDKYTLKDTVCSIEGSPLPPVKVTYDTEAKLWILVEEYVVAYDGLQFTIPRGFVFDLASVPRIVWWAIAPFELSLAAPLIHDVVYQFSGELPDGYVKPNAAITRKESDKLFRAMMHTEGVRKWRCFVAYTAVRLFGRFTWGPLP